MQQKEPISSLDSVMQYEINAIKNSTNYTVNWGLEVYIHTPRATLPVLYVERFDRLKDYVERFSDVINITVAVPGGMWTRDILPHKDKLEMTVDFIPLMSTTMYTRLLSADRLKKRYLAKLTSQSNPLVEGNNEQALQKRKLDSEQIVTVTFQLINKVVMALRSKTVGMIARQTTGMNVVKYCLTEHSKNLESGEPEDIRGVNIVPGYSEEVRDHVIVPHLTRLVSLPKVVDDAVGGLYPTGMSYYLDGNYWFVYPLFDTKRFAKAEHTLTIINIPANRMPGVEKTFRVTETQLILISTGQVKYQDNTISERDSLGDTVRFVDSRKVVEGFAKVGDNKLVADYTGNVTEMSLGDDVKDPSRASINTGVVVTSAYNKELTKLAMRNGSIATITWESSNDFVLYPGMPVRFMYLVDGQARQLYGTLLAAETMIYQANKGVKQQKFSSTTVLTCFLSKDVTNTSVE